MEHTIDPKVYEDMGLTLCTTCLGAEGSLPFDCPGERMSDEQERDVYAMKLNYFEDEGWVRKDFTHLELALKWEALKKKK